MAKESTEAKTLKAEIAQLGDLGLSALRARWLTLHGRAAPRFFRRKFLMRAIAHQMRAAVFGGLSEGAKRRLREIAAAASGCQSDADRLMPKIKPGTKLIRSHKGTTHSVLALEEGFEWQGRRFDSLSAIATAITGTKWNGWIFFGLKRAAATDHHDGRGKFKRPPVGPDGKADWIKTRRSLVRAGREARHA